MDASSESYNGLSPEDAVQVAFLEEDVGLSLTGDGEVKLVNRRKSMCGGTNGDESNTSPPKRGELQRNNSLKLLDVFRPSEGMKSCRSMRSMRFQNSKLCKSGELDVHLKKDPLVSRSDHGPAALSTYWMATRTPSDSFYDSNKSIDTNTVTTATTASSSIAQETSTSFEDASDGQQTIVTKVTMEGLSADDAAQFDGQGSFSIHPTSEEEEQQQPSPSKEGKRSSRSSSKSERNSLKARRPSRSKRESSAQRGKRRSSDGQLLPRSSPDMLNQREQKDKDGHRIKRKPARRQRSKSLTTAQPHILKSKARGAELTKPGISRERLRALSVSRRASMDVVSVNRTHISTGVADQGPGGSHNSFTNKEDIEIGQDNPPRVGTEVERSRRLHRRSSTQQEDRRGSSKSRHRSRSSRPKEDRQGSSQTRHRSKSKSRRFHRDFTNDEGQERGSSQPSLQRSSTVTGAGANKPLPVDQAVFRRTKTDTTAGRGRPNRSTSIDGVEPAVESTGETRRPSADPRRPRRRGSTGVVSHVGVECRNRSTSKTRKGTGSKHTKDEASSRHSRSLRRPSGHRLSCQLQDWQSEQIVSHYNGHEDNSEPDAGSPSTRSPNSDGFNRLSSTNRQKKIVDSLRSKSKDPELREAIVYDAGWQPRQQMQCQSSGMTGRQRRRSSMGATATSDVVGSECPSGAGRRQQRRSSLGWNPVPEVGVQAHKAGSHRAASRSRKEKRRSSMGRTPDKEPTRNDYGYDCGLHHHNEHQSSGVVRRDKFKRRASTH